MNWWTGKNECVRNFFSSNNFDSSISKSFVLTELKSVIVRLFPYFFFNSAKSSVVEDSQLISSTFLEIFFLEKKPCFSSILGVFIPKESLFWLI